MAPCKDGHLYCVDCMNRLFEGASRDETLFPPRCCQQPIPYDSVAGRLRAEVKSSFKAVEEEFSTRDRVYCPNKTCSNFLGSGANLITFAKGAKSVICAKCKGALCTTCRGVKHAEGFTCRGDKDATAQQVLKLGKIAGWQRCPGCGHMVELSRG